ncbi:MAG: DUF3418 domain-containing protein, partial [Syntrophales bacterium]|nr:DUF3418 domain-containing protein [Syntrophales bacterium]
MCIRDSLKALPKEYRKKLPPLAELGDSLVAGIEPGKGNLPAALSAFIHDKYRVTIPTSQWAVSRLPDHLRLRLEILDGQNRPIAAGRDLATLRREVVANGEAEGFAEARRFWEREGLKSWTMGDLPEAVPLLVQGVTMGWAFPALETAGEDVRLRLFKNRAEAEVAHRQGVRRLFEIRFSAEIRHLHKALILPPAWEQGANFFGGRKALAKILYEKVTEDLFAVPIRTEAAFHRHAEAVQRRILPRGQEVMALARPVVIACGETAETLSRLEKAEAKSPTAMRYLTSLKGEFARLVPRNFLILYEEDRLPHICRYLKALSIRAVRGLLDLEKAVRKEATVRSYEERLARLREEETAKDNPIKTAALQELAWMIEEYKVSLFAQELKTPYPVSPKRIEERFAEIDRM